MTLDPVNTPKWEADALTLIESPLVQLHRRLVLRLTGFHAIVKDKSARIMDLGFGAGPWLTYFTKLGFTDLSGIEPDGELMRRLPATVKAVVKNCKAEAIGFPDASFDVVFVYCVLHHLKGAESYIAASAEIARVLKPGGHVFIVEPGRYRVFRALEGASWVLGCVSRTFRALYDTMVVERPDQHFFLRNHAVVREELLARGLEPLVDDYFFYSWIFTAVKRAPAAPGTES